MAKRKNRDGNPHLGPVTPPVRRGDPGVTPPGIDIAKFHEDFNTNANETADIIEQVQRKIDTRLTTQIAAATVAPMQTTNVIRTNLSDAMQSTANQLTTVNTEVQAQLGEQVAAGLSLLPYTGYMDPPLRPPYGDEHVECLSSDQRHILVNRTINPGDPDYYTAPYRGLPQYEGFFGPNLLGCEPGYVPATLDSTGNITACVIRNAFIAPDGQPRQLTLYQTMCRIVSNTTPQDPGGGGGGGGGGDWPDKCSVEGKCWDDFNKVCIDCQEPGDPPPKPTPTGCDSATFTKICDWPASPLSVRLVTTPERSTDEQKRRIVEYARSVGACSVTDTDSKCWDRVSSSVVENDGCKTQENIDKLPKCAKKDAPVRYSLWQDSESGICYIQLSSEEPRKPTDVRRLDSDPATWNPKEIGETCSSNPNNPEPGSTPIFHPSGLGTCNALNDIVSLFNGSEPGYFAERLGEWYYKIHGETPSFVENPPGALIYGTAELGLKIVQQFITEIGGVVRELFGQNREDCDVDLGLEATRWLIAFCERWTGDSLDKLSIPLRLTSNFKCPQLPMSPAEGLAAYLANTINIEELECIVRAANVKFTSFRSLIDAQRTKLTPIDAINVRRRELIDQPTYQEYMRQLGILYDGERNAMEELAKFVPPISDLIRFMVRDVEDTKIVERFQLDSGFAEKWAGESKKWGTWQGVDETVANRYWRAHWQIPSYTQLVTMVHRSQKLKDGDPDKVTLEDVETAIQQNDMIPFWIKPLIRIAYRPLTRIDTTRAYKNGTIDLQTVRETYLDNGYNPENAETLTQFTRKSHFDSILTSPRAKQYIAGIISQQELESYATSRNVEADDIPKLIAAVNFERVVSKRKICITALRKRFFQGELTTDETVQAVIGEGIDPAGANDLVGKWGCEKSSRGKQQPLNELSIWYREGIIDAPNLYNRLTNLGFLADDALRVIQRLDLAIGRDNQSKELKRIAAEQAAAEKEQRNLEKQARQVAQATARQERALTEARKQKAQVEKSNLRTAQAVSVFLEMELADVYPAIRDTYKRIRQATGIQPPQVLYAMSAAAESGRYTTLDEFGTVALEITQDTGAEVNV